MYKMAANHITFSRATFSLIIFWTLFLVKTEILLSQSAYLDEKTYQAINNYLIYSNQVINNLEANLAGFENTNTEVNRLVENLQQGQQYQTDFNFQAQVSKPVHDEGLYVKLMQERQSIPAEYRAKSMDYVSKIKEVAQKVDDIRLKMDNYLKSATYKTDEHLSKSYEWLRAIELAYFDIYALQEKLFWQQSTILSSFNILVLNSSNRLLLVQWSNVLQQTKRLMRAVRAKDKSNLIVQDCNKMRDLIQDLKNNKTEYLKFIPKESKLFFDSYDQFLGLSESVLETAKAYSNKNDPQFSGRIHDPSYYYYNDILIKKHNRFYQDGLSHLYNILVSSSKEKLILADELPPIYEVIYPKHPAYSNYNKDSLPDAEKFFAQLQKTRADTTARKDSIVTVKIQKDSVPIVNNKKDSIKKNPEMSMEGFAANNLILLIDVSASMDEPEKLPLLKKSLQQFLNLLRDEDNISIISYSNIAEVVLPPTSARKKAVILDSLNTLKIKASSNVDMGLKLAYSMAKSSFIKGGNNKIILSTDGNFKLTPESKTLVKRKAKEDIRMSIFYFNKKEFKQVKENLSLIAKSGKGSYYYITDRNAEDALLKEAQSVRK